MVRWILMALLLTTFCDRADDERYVEYYIDSATPALSVEYYDRDGNSVILPAEPLPFRIGFHIPEGEQHLFISAEFAVDSLAYSEIRLDDRVICHSDDFGTTAITELITNDESGFFTCVH